MFEHTFVDRIKEEKIANDFIFINITDFRQCDHAIRKSDLVVAMVPDVMLLQVSDSCIAHGKSLVAPSRLNRQLAQKKAKAEEAGVLLLFECGFTPGLDHVTAKQVIDNIRTKGGQITSFKTLSGSLVAESSIDNPWEFKMTETAPELINLGKGNNRFLINGQLQHIPHHLLFTRSEPVAIRGIREAVAIPEDDSLYYRKIYDLQDAETVMKARIVRKGFESVWDLVVRLGLTNTTSKIDLLDDKSFLNFIKSMVPFSPTESLDVRLKKYLHASHDDIDKLRWLGLFDNDWMEGYKEITPAIILQHLLEKKLALQPHDKDCIVMRHEVEYFTREFKHQFTATLIAQGEDQRNSATAKAIGLTTGAAAKALMLENIKIKGLHTPAKRDIYEPMLNELEDLGVAFHVEEKKVRYEDLGEKYPEPVAVPQVIRK
jgi:saccharopine dehydrogenase (NADP+, L-glutamate forming)